MQAIGPVPRGVGAAILAAVVCVASVCPKASAQEKGRSAEYEHEPELRRLVPASQHGAVDFLLAHMPARDRGLSPALLAEHLDYAYRARARFPWARDVPEDIFLNNVLPYASLNERRDAWRRRFYDDFGAMVADCKTGGEAAVKLNTTIYDRLNVHYSRERPKADQSSFESIKAGKASCTGLSILLVDACRAVGVPARVVGTPEWVGTRGNHTWVEIWDDGWHYLGASESKALNQGWFTAKAAGQTEGELLHAIYASSFKSTDTYFPLPWNRAARYVNAVDVTRRYARAGTPLASVAEITKLVSRGPLPELLKTLEEKDRFFALKDFAPIKALVWQQYVAGVEKNERRQREHQEKAVSYNGKTMRYGYERVGEQPAEGYPLYIALHGGGGAPQRVNDGQWAHMKVYYLGGVTNGIYLAARGVTDSWNLHWVKESFACYDRIIENMIVFEGVDPNRVYLMGYSAGGDAAYQVPARMPDRWAGVAMSAGHPNGVPVDNYASLAFLIQVGERDAAYRRNTVAAQYGVKIDALKSAHPAHYEHATYVHAGRGHGFMDHDAAGRPQKVYAEPAAWLEQGSAATATNLDCHSIHWLNKHVRDPLPTKVIWDCTTRAERSGEQEAGFWPSGEKGRLHYWVGLDRYDKDVALDAKRIVVELDRPGNAIKVMAIGNFARFYLQPGMLNLGASVSVTMNGTAVKATPKPSLRVMVQTLLDRGDPNYIFPVCLTLSRNPEGSWMFE